MNPNDFDLDKMIKDIDAKIAELEKEEEEEKKKAAAKQQSMDDTKVLGGSKEEGIKPNKPSLDETIQMTPINELNTQKPQSDVIDSKMINLNDFSLKEESNVKKEEEKKEDSPIVNKKETNNILNSDTNDYDDFFDDFFFEE